MTHVYEAGDRVTDRNVYEKRRGVVRCWTRDGNRRKYLVQWDLGGSSWHHAPKIMPEVKR